MATYYGAQKSSIDGVMTWYEEQDQAAYVVYRHNTKSETARYDGNDKETGGQRLIRFLSEIEPTDYAIYILQLAPSSKKKDAGAPSVTFQLYKKEPGMYGPNPYQLNEVISKINAIQARLDSEENEEEEEEEGELAGAPAAPDAVPPITFDNNFIGSVMAQPMVQQFLITSIVGFMSKMMGNNVPGPVTAVAGIETDEDLQKTIETLFSKGVTPGDLAKLAAMDQGQINFLLSMLRK